MRSSTSTSASPGSDFADAYGLPARDRLEVVDALLPVHDHAYDVVREAVSDGHTTFARLWNEGGRERADRARQWITAHGREMREVLRPT